MNIKTKPLHQALGVLASLKFGIGLLVIIALAGVFSTLIPQGEPAMYYQVVYGHALGSFLYYSSLTRVLTSPWFLLSAVLLLLNLTLCSGKRFLKTRRSGNWSAYGSTILHLGLVSIIVGGLMSSYLGRSDYLEIPVQDTATMAVSGQPFQLKVENFNIEYYQGEQGQPKQYRTKLTVLENNQPVNTQEIHVNKPLQHRDVKVYQSGYGWMVAGQLNVYGDDQPRPFNVVAGQPMVLDEEYTLAVIPASEEVEGDFLYRLIHREQAHFNGQAAINEQVSLPVGTIEFTGLKRYTGLEVRHDPGVPVVWGGFALLTVGLAMRLFCHRSKGDIK